MRYKYIFLVLLTIFSCTNEKVINKLENLYRSEDYFEFNRLLQQNKESLPAYAKLYFQALSLNLLNKPAESNQLIEEILAKYTKKFPDTVLVQLLETKASNAGNLFDFKTASNTLNGILASHASVLSRLKLNDMKDDSVIYQTIKNCQPQTVDILNDDRINLTRDKIGLMNLPVTGSGSDSSMFIFDTGANFSTITRSTALKLNLKIFDKKIKVKAMGGQAEASLGDCPELKIGSAIFHHVIFLIFPDSALYFKQVNYQINGIIGFPVMRALKQITIANDNFYIYKHQSSSNFQNLLLNGLQPIVEIEYKGFKLPFNFDSGANTTDLFVAFYNKFKNDTTLKTKDTTVLIGGAAGLNKFNVKKVDAIQLKTGNKTFNLHGLHMHISDKILPTASKFYGNIGQDFIHNYKSMTINFDKMFIDFE
jgi:hypothetical protein